MRRAVVVSLISIGVLLLLASLVWESFFPLRSRWSAEAAAESARLTQQLNDLLTKTAEARRRVPSLTGEPLALEILREKIAASDAARDRAIEAPVKTARRLRDVGLGVTLLGIFAWLVTLRRFSASRSASGQ